MYLTEEPLFVCWHGKRTIKTVVYINSLNEQVGFNKSKIYKQNESFLQLKLLFSLPLRP